MTNDDAILNFISRAKYNNCNVLSVHNNGEFWQLLYGTDHRGGFLVATYMTRKLAIAEAKRVMQLANGYFTGWYEHGNEFRSIEVK